MGLLPKDYRDPSAGSNYLKLEEGTVKIRLLSEPVMGWEYWVENDGKKSPVRVKEFKDVPQEHRAPVDNRLKAKYFWALLVWNYDEKRAQVWEITQSGIRNAIVALDNDPDWGDAREYDLAVTRTGEGLDTNYQVIQKPKNKFDKKGKDIPQVNLNALFTNDDPFIVTGENPADKNEDLDFSDLDDQLASTQ